MLILRLQALMDRDEGGRVATGMDHGMGELSGRCCHSGKGGPADKCQSSHLVDPVYFGASRYLVPLSVASPRAWQDDLRPETMVSLFNVLLPKSGGYEGIGASLEGSYTQLLPDG